jgi:hypothetical protein
VESTRPEAEKRDSLTKMECSTKIRKNKFAKVGGLRLLRKSYISELAVEKKRAEFNLRNS